MEDYNIVRDAIKHRLPLDSDVGIVSEAKNKADFFKALETSGIHALILDHIVQDKYSHIKIIAHAVLDDAERVATVIRSGTLGFVSKRSGFEKLIRAIKTVYVGAGYICHE